MALSQAAPGAAEYQRAQAALARKDCATAITELEAYKKAAAAQLKNQQNFARLVDQQIAHCKDIASRKLSTIEIFGNRRADDFTARDLVKEKAIQFRAY